MKTLPLSLDEQASPANCALRRTLHRLLPVGFAVVGIGLSVVNEFVQAHGGSIEIVDGVFPGAHFRVRLPLGPASRSSRGDAASGAVSGAGPSHGAAGPPRSVVSAAEPLPGAGPGGAQ